MKEQIRRKERKERGKMNKDRFEGGEEDRNKRIRRREKEGKVRR